MKGWGFMSFPTKEAEQLLVDTGRQCCICGILHKVQLHHIIPPEKGGTDDIDNAIPLCPNCHDEVHREYASGQVTRGYSARELRLHRQRAVDRVRKEGEWEQGSPAWEEDKDLVLFYAQCLDRPAFRTRFHQEMSFSAFDKAMEDTIIALNTGYWRMRDGTLIDRSKGKAYLTHRPWREKLDGMIETIETIRSHFHKAVGFDRALLQGRYSAEIMMEERFRHDLKFGSWMDQQRQEVIEAMNSILEEIGHLPLKKIEVR
jgi:hypothetical protein